MKQIKALLFSFQNISIRFNATPIIAGLSFDIAGGDKLVIQGKSGAGKTSLLNVITGFVRPDQGKVFFEDHQLNPATIGRLRSQMACLPQQINFGSYTVKQFLELPFGFEYNTALKPDEARITHFFNQFNLAIDLQKAKMQDVSGGEKQRIALISCLLLQRKILLLDEPTSALDKESKQIVMDYIFENTGQTIISASHDPDWIARCNKIVTLEKNSNGNH